MSELATTGLIGLAAVAGWMVLAWVLSLIKRDAGIVDNFWGSGFTLVAWVYALQSSGAPPRRWLMLALVTAWGLRLTLHIFLRNYGQPEDYRYREMRELRGAAFPWISLFTVFLLQALILWWVSAPLLQALVSPVPARLIWLDGLGAAVVLMGLFFETVADLQLTRFRGNPANRGKVLDSGLWYYSRHPNYFGDALVWWGLFLVALATPGAWWTVGSPLLMTLLLLKVSGVTLLEKKLEQTRPAYRDYAARTNAFIPWFPRHDRSTEAR